MTLIVAMVGLVSGCENSKPVSTAPDVPSIPNSAVDSKGKKSHTGGVSVPDPAAAKK